MAALPDFDVIIAGGGLAGACAALILSADRRVCLFEAEHPAAGASGAAAGLINPLMGRKANPVDQLHASLDAAHTLINKAGAQEHAQTSGVLRPTVEEKQVEFFQDALEEHPDVAEWLSPEAVTERYPSVQTKGGALYIPRGGAVDVSGFVTHMLNTARQQGATVHTGARVADWNESFDAAQVDVSFKDGSQEQLSARWLVLALGWGFLGYSAFEALDLRGVKGQTVRVRCPDEVDPDQLIPMSGRGYIVPDGNTLVLGSSYENEFDDLEPSDESTQYILNKTSEMLPALDGAEVVDARAGVRVYAGSSNQPFLGPLPDHERCWAFTGLGSKGLLTAPRLARHLPRYLDDPSAIPSSHGTN